MSAGGQQLEGFSQYYERTMRQQASENYWNEVGMGGNQFGGYDPVVAEKDTDILTLHKSSFFSFDKIWIASGLII